MCCVKPFVVLAMAALHFAVVPWCERPDNFVDDAVRLQMHLK